MIRYPHTKNKEILTKSIIYPHTTLTEYLIDRKQVDIEQEMTHTSKGIIFFHKTH